jgi:hypothetical protein
MVAAVAGLSEETMKRDMELVRAILLEAEKMGPRGGQIEIDDRSVEEINYHIKRMDEAGLIHALISKTILSGSTPPSPYRIIEITWKGHDFLDAARNDRVWRKVLGRVGAAVSTATLEVIMATLADEAKRQIGLPP